MMKITNRILSGLMFAIPLGLISAVLVKADSPQSGLLEEVGETPECKECHISIYTAWEESAHGQAVTDPSFVEAWDAQGNPGNCLVCHTTGYDPVSETWLSDGVGCFGCHDAEESPNHPNTIIPTERSPKLCGTCHIATLSDWEVSAHSSDEIVCVNCHTPHSTGIRKEGVDDLCASCHAELVSSYAYSKHYAGGLLCMDCHLKVNEELMGEGHGRRDHTFMVKLSTCSECHKETHGPPKAAAFSGSTEPPDSMVSAISTAVSAEPRTVNPIGFIALAITVGLGAGVILAPWLERLYRRVTS